MSEQLKRIKRIERIARIEKIKDTIKDTTKEEKSEEKKMTKPSIDGIRKSIENFEHNNRTVEEEER